MNSSLIVQVEKYVGYKRGTLGFHWNADYLLENLSVTNHESVVYQKLKYLEVQWEEGFSDITWELSEVTLN